MSLPPPEIPWSKLHPLTPLMQGGVVFVIIVGIVVTNMRDRFIGVFYGEGWATDESFDPISAIIRNGLVLMVLAGVLVLIIVVVALSWLSWRFHSYRVTEENVEMKQGVLFRKHRRAPLLRIQSVNVQRPLIARALGLAKLQVQTAGQDGDLMLSYLSHQTAKTLRSQILERVQFVRSDSQEVVDFLGQVHGSAETVLDRRAHDFIDIDVDAEAARTGSLVRITPGRLIGSVLVSEESIFALIALIAVPITAIYSSLFVLTSLIPLVLVFGGIMFSRFNRGFNFTISAAGDGVRTGSGLTSTFTETVPRHRIHAIDVSQPFLWRLTGWWRIRITTGGAVSMKNNQNVFQHIMLPVGTLDDVHRVLGLMLPGYDNESGHHELHDALIGEATGFTRAGGGAKFLYWLQHRRFGVRLAHDGELDATVLMRRGRFVRRLTITPLLRVQSLEVRSSPLRRFAGVADLRIHTVMGPVQPYVQGLAVADAQRWFEVLAPSLVRVMRADNGEQS